ncbi:MAG: homoserine acetyltransferase [Flavobacteriaceae bacterium]|nr:homoserine acetyltransferase [Flavobacteriaceae bacterium]|tara:strand:- start:6040 stop:7005 length:966 start_codon:yes stop_codon:yes gene_type:complete
MSKVKTISIPNFTTASGSYYDKVELHYQHFGRNYINAPVVLINHSLTGDANVAGSSGWWNEIVGPNLTIDTKTYAILAFNIPGNGVNNYTIENYQDFHTGDIAEIFYKGLQVLGVEKLFALIGGSIGGGIAWEMAALYPSLTKNLIPVAADWKASDWIIANTFLQKRLLENSNDPIRDARIHAMLTYRTPASFSERFGRTKNLEKNIYNVESWLIHHGDKLFKRFLLKAYKTMNHLLASVDITRNGKSIEKVIKSIESDIHLIAIDSDIFFTPEEDQKTFKIGRNFKKKIYYHELNSIHGHDAFLIENKAISKILRNIFKT